MRKFKYGFLALAAITMLSACTTDDVDEGAGSHLYTYQMGDYGYRLQEVPINSVADYEQPVLIRGEVIRLMGDSVILSGETGEIYVKIGPVYENLGVKLGSEIEVIGIYDLNHFRAIEVAVGDGAFQPATAY